MKRGERSSRYFHGLEKRNAKEKAWSNILDENGEILTGTTNIMNRQVEFYKNLYTSEGTDINKGQMFLNSVETQLDDSNKQLTDKDVDLNDLTRALQKNE